MNPFTYARPASAADALQLAGQTTAKFLGGGTNLVDLMRETIEQPAALVDLTALPAQIEEHGGGLMIAAQARNTAVAEHARVRADYPVLARAILSGASPQIRNMATVGGNIMQRTRCSYFYDRQGARCNKRQPGTGCDAREGFNRTHAILGASADCVATHPSDMCVALAALDAIVHVRGERGARTIPLADFHRLPGDRPDVETQLAPGELIAAVQLPPPLGPSAYRKVRDRASYAFGLVSVAAVLVVRDGTVEAARIALGGVAHKPWRASTAEAALIGKPAGERSFRAAADAELTAAQPLRDNAFKIELAARTIVAVLSELCKGQS